MGLKKNNRSKTKNSNCPQINSTLTAKANADQMESGKTNNNNQKNKHKKLRHSVNQTKNEGHTKSGDMHM